MICILSVIIVTFHRVLQDNLQKRVVVVVGQSLVFRAVIGGRSFAFGAVSTEGPTSNPQTRKPIRHRPQNELVRFRRMKRVATTARHSNLESAREKRKTPEIDRNFASNNGSDVINE